MQKKEGQYIHGSRGARPSPLQSPVSVIALFACCAFCVCNTDAARSENIAQDRSKNNPDVFSQMQCWSDKTMMYGRSGLSEILW